MFLCYSSVPFAVDGIRYRNYHLPRWIVNLMFMGVTSVTLTFLIALFLLAPQVGFMRIMVYEGNFFLHTLIPILSIVLFLFVNDYHRVRFRTTFLAMLPMVLYSVVYLISAIFVGEENGGWRDHYQFESWMPWYYVAIFIYLFTFVIASGLRFGHNLVHAHDKRQDKGGELIVPRRIIKFMENKYQSGKSMETLCHLYISEYLKED